MPDDDRDRPLGPLAEPPPVGSRVRVLAGPFAGRTGVVAELDGRGGARDSLGELSTRVAVEHLAVTQGRNERPTLGSSHRRRGGRRG